MIMKMTILFLNSVKKFDLYISIFAYQPVQNKEKRICKAEKICSLYVRESWTFIREHKHSF